MRCFGLVLAVAVILASFVARSEALTVIVPDDYPTVQAVMDSQYVKGIDRVYVRPGVVEDSLYGVISGYFTVIGLGDSLTRPQFGPTEVYSNYPLTFENVTFTGRVFTVDAELVFRDCRLQAGLSSPIYGHSRSIVMDRCRINGLVYLGSDSFAAIDSCWFDDGRIQCDENSLDVTNTTFTGAGPAIDSYYESRGQIRGNTFRVSGVGIEAVNSDQTFVENVFEDCAVGIRTSGGQVLRNTIRRCGIGISGTDDVLISENLVMDSEGEGIHFRGASDELGLVERNVVFRSGGDGFVVDGRGSPWFEIVIRNNTSVDNDGSGYRFQLGGSYPLYVWNNIGYGNGAHGLVSAGDFDPLLACNDWFANDSSAVSGMTPPFNDFYLDPMFCDVAQDDVALFANSPLVNAMHCGLVGARGVGCETAATPSPVTPSSVMLAPVTPNPSAGAVRLRWALPREQHVDVTIHDVSGRRIATLARGVHRAGLHDAEWRGSAAPSGVYFVRLRSGETSVTRSFLVRR
jgi:hypothetical protein